MQWNPEKLGTIVWGAKIALAIVFIGAMFLCFIGGLFAGPWVCLAIGLAVIIAWMMYIWKGFKQVPQEKCYVIEVFGAYWMTWETGLHWLPYFLAKAREQVSTWVQRYPLFEESIFIDFKDGSASPKGAMAFIRMEDDPDAAKKMVYEVKNLKAAVTSLLENATRSFLNGLTIQKGIEEGTAGYDIFPNFPNNGEIRETLASWGLVLEKITVGDFDLSPTIIKDREAVHQAMQEEMAMDHILEKRAKEIQLFIKTLSEATGKTMAEIKEEISNNPVFKKEFAAFVQEIISRHISLEAGALTDIRVSGGSPLESTILKAIAAFKRL